MVAGMLADPAKGVMMCKLAFQMPPNRAESGQLAARGAVFDRSRCLASLPLKYF